MSPFPIDPPARCDARAVAAHVFAVPTVRELPPRPIDGAAVRISASAPAVQVARR